MLLSSNLIDVWTIKIYIPLSDFAGHTHSWQKITNSKVEIESESEFSRVILYLPGNGANDAQTTRDGANLGANDTQTTRGGANLGANKQRILHAIQMDNTLSVLKLQVLTNIPLRTLQREVNELIALGVLKKGGTRKILFGR